MIICCLGDSLTEGDYGVHGKRGIANVHEKNYPYYLAKMLGAEVRNFGKCGYRPTDFFDRWDINGVDITNADIILIMLGANGGMSEEDETPQNYAYRKIVARCRKEAPSAEILLITTPHVTVNTEYSNCGYAIQVNEAVGFTRRYAREAKLRLIDLASYKTFCAKNEKVLQPNDGLHYAAFGYFLMAKFIAQALKKEFPKIIKYKPFEIKRKVSISTSALQRLYGDERALEIAALAGADGVDFNLCRQDFRDNASPYSLSQREMFKYYSALKAKAKKLGLEFVQTHGRITGFRNDAAEDEALIVNAKKDIRITKLLGAPVCVFHTATSIFMGADANASLMRELNDSMFLRLLDAASKYNVKIATETFGDATGLDAVDFFGQQDEFVAAYRRVRETSPNGHLLKVCADTGHSNKATRFAQPSPADVIRGLGEAVDVLHLNDNDTFTDQHKIPTEGCIDWENVFNALDGIGYDGVFNIEVIYGHDGESEKDIIGEAVRSVQKVRCLIDERYAHIE